MPVDVAVEMGASKSAESDHAVSAFVRELNQLQDDVYLKTSTCRKLQLRSIKSSELLASLQSEIRSLQTEQEELLQKRPPAAERLKQVQGWLSERMHTFQAQQENHAAIQSECMKAQAALLGAEKQMQFLLEKNAAARQLIAQQEEQAAKTAGMQRAKEEEAAHRLAKKLERASQQQDSVMLQEQQLRSAAVRTAKSQRKKAVAALAKSFEASRDSVEVIQEMQNSLMEQQTSVVLNLKKGIDRAQQNAAEVVSLKRQLQKQKEELEAKQFQDLVEQGLNPYEVYRKADIEAEVQEARQKIKTGIVKKKELIMAQLEKERQQLLKEQSAKEYEAAVRARFSKEMGVEARQNRVEKYLKQHTVGGQAMLDPTGRLPIHMSDAVTAKTNHFGLGMATSQEIDLVKRGHPDMDVNDSLLIPRALRDARDIEEQPPGITPKAPSAKLGASNKLQTKSLSKVEQEYMAQAAQRHKQSIGAPQVMMGREFSGDAFVVSPTTVLFNDFDVGQRYKAKVKVTNVSFKKNSFRLMDLPVEAVGVIELEYEPSGHIASGIAAEITVYFTPKVDENMQVQIPLLADTGLFHFEVKCSAKKACITVSEDVVDFESRTGVVLGHSAKRVVTLTNDGALAVSYAVTFPTQEDSASFSVAASATNPERSTLTQDIITSPQSRAPFKISSLTGTVPGYKKASFSITFEPNTAEYIERNLLLKYKCESHKPSDLPPHLLKVCGLGRNVPVYAERTLLDFQCCLVGHTYRDALVLRNIGKTALKVTLVKRPEVLEFFHVYPDFGYCQAGEAFPITFTVEPVHTMLTSLAKFLQPGTSDTLSIPMKVQVQGQTKTVDFSIQLCVTDTSLEFSPTSLQFGRCAMPERKTCTLMLTNRTVLPQIFGFPELPPGVAVQPSDGFGRVLPGETLKLLVSFQPKITGYQTFNIRCQTLCGRTFVIPCKGDGCEPPLTFSVNSVQLPATVHGEKCNAFVTIKNDSDNAQTYEFAVPEGSNLNISPKVAIVPVNGWQRVQIEFAPPALAEEPPPPQIEQTTELVEAVKPSKKSTKALKASLAKPDDKGYKKSDATTKTAPSKLEVIADNLDPTTTLDENMNPSYITTEVAEEYPWDWRSWTIPCFIKPSQSDEDAPREPQAIHLNVETCAVEADLVLDPSIPKVAKKGYYEWDFGAVPVGQRVVKDFLVVNVGEESTQLKSEPLDQSGVFYIVNALKPVAPGSSMKLRVGFQPQSQTQYYEMLTARASKSRLCIVLKGNGMVPKLEVSPESALSGLDFGDVSAGEQREQKLNIKNACPFSLSYTLKFDKPPTETSLTGMPPFYSYLEAGTLTEGQTHEVAVVFKPDHQRPYFQSRLHIVVPNQQEELVVPLKGRGWSSGMFVAGGEYLGLKDDPYYESQLKQLVAQAEAAQQQPANAKDAKSKDGKQAASRMSTPSPAPVTHTMVVTFPSSCKLGGSATASFEVGSLKSALGGSSGEVVMDEIPPEMKDAGWSLDPVRVSVGAGEKKAVVVRYSPPKDAANLPAYYGVPEFSELNLGCMVKGGTPAPQNLEGTKVLLKFRCLVEPMDAGDSTGDAVGVSAGIKAGAQPKKVKK